MNEWEKRATDFILGIILYLITVIQIDIIAFCLGKRDWPRSTLPNLNYGFWYNHMIQFYVLSLYILLRFISFTLFDLVVCILHLYSYIRFEKRQWILKETMKILSRCILMNLILAGRVKEGVRESDLFVI